MLLEPGGVPQHAADCLRCPSAHQTFDPGFQRCHHVLHQGAVSQRANRMARASQDVGIAGVAQMPTRVAQMSISQPYLSLVVCMTLFCVAAQRRAQDTAPDVSLQLEPNKNHVIQITIELGTFG